MFGSINTKGASPLCDGIASGICGFSRPFVHGIQVDTQEEGKSMTFSTTTFVISVAITSFFYLLFAPVVYG